MPCRDFDVVRAFFSDCQQLTEFSVSFHAADTKWADYCALIYVQARGQNLDRAAGTALRRGTKKCMRLVQLCYKRC